MRRHTIYVPFVEVGVGVTTIGRDAQSVTNNRWNQYDIIYFLLALEPGERAFTISARTRV